MSTTNSTATMTEYDRLALIAKNTPCDFDDCDGTLHDYKEEPAEWLHQVIFEKFDDGTVEAIVTGTTQGFKGEIWFGAEGDMTAAEFRAEADKYEAFPAWLRGHADRLDALNTAHRA